MNVRKGSNRRVKRVLRRSALGLLIFIAVLGPILIGATEARAGGTVIISTHTEPDILLWRFTNVYNAFWIASTTSAPMLRFGPDRKFRPNLLTQVPSLQNGGGLRMGRP